MSDTRLEFVISAVNRAQAALAQVGNNFDQLAQKVQAFNRAAASGAAGSGNAWRAFGGVLQTVGRTAERALGAVLKAVGGLASGVLSLAGNLAGSLVSAMGALGRAAATAAAVVGGTLATALIAVGKAGVDMNVTLETVQRAFTKISGSSGAAAGLIAGLRKEAETSALTFKDLLPLAQGLGAVLVDVYGAKGLGKTIPILRAFGDAAATLGVGVGDQQNALRGFRQLLSSGDSPTKEDLKQVDEALPGAGVMATVKRRFGSTDGDTLKAAGVTGAMIAEAIIAGMQAKFGGAQAEMAGTLPIILSNFADAFNNMSAAVTARFTPALTKALGQVLGIVQSLSTNERFLSALAVPFELLGVAVQSAADALPAFVDWFTQVASKDNIINFLANVVGTVRALGDEINRFVNAATGGQGISGIFEAFGKIAYEAVNQVLKVWGGLVAGVDYLVKNWPSITQQFAKGLADIKAAAEAILPVFVALWGAAKVAQILSVVAATWKWVAALRAGAAVGGAGAAAAGSGLGVAAGAAAAGGAAIAGGVALAAGAGLAIGAVVDATLTGPAFKGWLNRDKAQQTAQIKHQMAVARERRVAAEEGRAPRAIVGPGLEGIAGGLAGAVQGGYASSGLPPYMQRQGQYAADAAAKIRKMLGGGGGGGGAADSGLPPAHQMGGPASGGGSGAGGAAVGGKEADKALKNALTARNNYFDTLVDQAKAAAELAPQAMQAIEEVAKVIPALQSKGQELLAQARRLNPQSKEYWDTQQKFWDVQREVNRIQDRGVKQQADNARKASEEAKDLVSSRLELAKAKIGNNPFLSGPERQRAMLPLLLERFKLLNRGMAGESRQDQMQRLTEAEGVKGDILSSEGFGDGFQAADPRSRQGKFQRGRFASIMRALQGMAGSASQQTVAGEAPKPPQAAFVQNANGSFSFPMRAPQAAVMPGLGAPVTVVVYPTSNDQILQSVNEALARAGMR